MGECSGAASYRLHAVLAQLRRLLPYLHRYGWRYTVGATCVIAAVALRFSIPFLLGDSIDSLRETTDVAPEDAGRLREQILVGALLMIAAAAAGAFIRTTSRLMILGNSRLAVHDVRTDVFAQLLRLAPSFYVRHRTGHIMSRTVNDMQNVQGLLGPVFMYLVETGVLYSVGIAFMVAADPMLTLVGLAPFPFFLYLARRLARRVQEGSRAAQEKLGDVSAKVDESLSGQRVIRSLVVEDFDRQRFDELCLEYRATMVSVAGSRAILTATMTFLAALSTFLVLAVGAPAVSSGAVTVGQLVAFILYLGMLAGPTRTLGFVLSSLQRGAAALGRIGEILDMPVTIADGHGEGEIRDGEIDVSRLRVEFASSKDEIFLSGSLEEGEVRGGRVVLEDVSFRVPAGTTLGVVGPVGSGKSTLLRALARQVEIDPGMVRIDGNDITELPLPEVRRQVAVAPQDAFLFSDTVANNVRFGEPEAPMEQVRDAVEVAQLSADLDQLPAGLETMLGERGINLSGGQRQRTSLARCAILRPRVLLLDDTLSAVDTHTADAILARLRPLMADRTTVVVAHRLSTVRDADRILVLDEGRIRESGTHDELVALGGYYAEVYAQQSQREGLERELGVEEAS